MRLVEAKMSWLDTSAVSEGPMASLAETSLAANFHFWRGASGRRYAMSVAKIDTKNAAASLPDLDGFVLVGVTRHDGKCTALDVAAVERTVDRRAMVVAALANGADEWHVYLLGTDRVSRAAIVADLKTRHVETRRALSA